MDTYTYEQMVELFGEAAIEKLNNADSDYDCDYDYDTNDTYDFTATIKAINLLSGEECLIRGYYYQDSTLDWQVKYYKIIQKGLK